MRKTIRNILTEEIVQYSAELEFWYRKTHGYITKMPSGLYYIHFGKRKKYFKYFDHLLDDILVDGKTTVEVIKASKKEWY